MIFASMRRNWWLGPSKKRPGNASRQVRSYDPCISCATHFLRVVVEREDAKD